ncbi:MAG: thiolase family protein [Arenicella sp.]|nr:thiolase family protein [Arenicella sp.]
MKDLKISELDPNDVVIVAAKRTPLGSMLGHFADITAPDLGAVAIKSALATLLIKPSDIDEVIMGNVVSAGLKQAPARQASLNAGVPTSVPCTTVNKVCGSGMKAAMFAHDQIKAGSAQIVVAGGMESMSRAPYLMERARQGYRMGHAQLLDSLFLDGLEDAQTGGSMGTYGQTTADDEGFTREQMDAYAIESLQRAKAAHAEGRFFSEIAAVEVKSRAGTYSVDQDEQPGKASIEKIPTLRPAFKADGTVTAATSSSMSDGAAALVIMSAAKAAELEVVPLARIVAHASHAQAPNEFCKAPAGAISKVLEKANWKAADVDLYEINEAFAVVSLYSMREHNLAHDRVNVNGGACAIGHPLGASGARLLVTLLHALRTSGGHTGIASLCIGGGEATAVALEMCSS